MSGPELATVVASAISDAPLPSNTFVAGTPSTITMNAVGALVIDGYTVTQDDTVVVKDEADQTHNGVYRVTTPGDASTQAVLTSFGFGPVQFANCLAIASQGTVNALFGWGVLTPAAVTTGIDDVVFTRLFPKHH